MSRNVRRKFPPSTPVKVTTKRRRRVSDTSSSSFDLSDEDGYSAVEDISDSSDDDEEDVAAAEEENIVEENNAPTPIAPRPRLTVEDDDDGDDDDDEGPDVDEDDAGSEAGSWAGIMSDVDENDVSDFFQDANAFGSDIPVERHVHFDVPSSDSDSTDTEDDHADLFPDIFVSQNALDPAFRREIENDPNESEDSGSFWDYSYTHADQPDSDAEEVVRQLSDDDTPTATPMASQTATAASTPLPTFEEPQELDGYETDGDTTEEDIPEPPVRRKTRRPSNPLSDDSDSDTDSPVKSQRGQPRVGRFNLDRSDRKPIAVLNPLTRKMMIFTPHRRRQLDLSPEQFHFPWPMEMEDQSSPIMSNSANMMLSAMFSSNTFGDFINTQAMGPAEAFFPFPSEPNTADESSSASLHDDDDDAEEKLDINDFIMWDDGQSSGDEGEGEWDPQSTPARPSTAGSEIEVLSHLNSETVGAFRRNQINQQLILSNQATQDSLAFSGPYNYTALKGLKSDRFDTAAVPLTPMRRHKRHMSDATRSPLDSVSAKRKASGDASSSHKRHRSISDVNLLRI
ncbi:hypothetical protein B0J13DRAFT_106912 [Dactylonectria estremocensis]|uniref:Uncharacterized protein n=1 Tax=Dactylonectria estremocensis TaxID=1079267 RepID=A0A9P9E536_9HYPO|nr:hypothetical protein B0J13DRAFT_106912 [Dactylonectria estremocensis]